MFDGLSLKNVFRPKCWGKSFFTGNFVVVVQQVQALVAGVLSLIRFYCTCKSVEGDDMFIKIK